MNIPCTLLTSRFGWPRAQKAKSGLSLTFCSNICRFLTAHLSKEGSRKRYSRLFFSFLTQPSNARKCPTHRKQGAANTWNPQRSSNMLSPLQFGIWFGYLDVYLSIEYMYCLILVWLGDISVVFPSYIFSLSTFPGN